MLQFALAKIGAILVTANTSLRARDIDYLLRQSEAATLVTISGFRDVDYVAELGKIGATAGTIPTLKRLIFVGETTAAALAAVAGPSDPVAVVRYADIAGHATRIAETHLDARGAGGRRRRRDQHAVHVGHDRVSQRRDALQPQHRQQRLRAAGRCSATRRHDRLCLCVPLFHCFGCVIGVLGAFTHGACLCPVEAFDPKRVLETVDRERCTALYGVPTMFIAELEHPDFSSYDLTSLRTGVMAGALCPEPLMRRVMTDMHLPEITIAYGLTEAVAGHHDDAARLVGGAAVADRRRPSCPKLEVKIVDPATGARPRDRRARRAVLRAATT